MKQLMNVTNTLNNVNNADTLIWTFVTVFSSDLSTQLVTSQFKIITTLFLKKARKIIIQEQEEHKTCANQIAEADFAIY